MMERFERAIISSIVTMAVSWLIFTVFMFAPILLLIAIVIGLLCGLWMVAALAALGWFVLYAASGNTLLIALVAGVFVFFIIMFAE